MRVLQINSVCGVGSTGRIATDLNTILLDKKHESYIAYGRNASLNCDNSLKIGSNLDVYCHVLKTRVLDQHGFGSKKATKRFINTLIKLDPDIIHLHNIHGYYLNIEILFDYLKVAQKPVIWTLHDCWSFTGHCSYFEYNGCKCWDGYHKCIQKNSYPKSLFINNSKENFERKRNAFTGVENLTIVTPSKWLKQLVKKTFLKDYPVKVINNGVDQNIFKPTISNFRKNYNLNKHFIILGVASRWDFRKGLMYFKQLSGGLNKNEKIVLIGLTEEDIDKLPDNIIGISKTNNVTELAEIYSSADVFVNPTLEDNFPTTNLESLSCGTPVITFATGGSPESVSGNSGYVVEKGNVDELYEQIQMVKSNGKQFYTNYAIKRARKLYDKNKSLMNYLDLYEKMQK